MTVVQSKSWTDQELIALWNAGYEQAEIARETGLTRQRIGQRLSRNGLRGKNPHARPSAESIRAAAAAATSFDAVARRLGVTVPAVLQAADQHSVRDEIGELLKSNRRQQAAEARVIAQRAYVRKLRDIALAVGHTPTAADLQQHGIFPMSLHQRFGSVQDAMQAAGLRPNRPGLPPEQLPPDYASDTEATEDTDVLHDRADRLRRVGLDDAPPVGSQSPRTTQVSTRAYYRSPAVAAWALEQAGGVCEACGEAGYETDDGTQFLEIHHVIPLASGGPDTVCNVVAVCETCHGKLHRWKYRAALADDLYAKLPRLSRPAPAAQRGVEAVE